MANVTIQPPTGNANLLDPKSDVVLGPVLQRHIVLQVVVGSTLHGISVDDGHEDLDLLTIVVEDIRDAMGLVPCDVWTARSKPEGERSMAGDVDHTVMGLRKYVRLALDNNPTMLLPLFVPSEFRRKWSMFGYTLQSLSNRIVSKLAFDRFQGYLQNQWQRVLEEHKGARESQRPELVQLNGYDVKRAAHTIRLAIQGAELLRTGRITLPMPDQQREMVRSVRLGKYTLDELTHLLSRVEADLVHAAAHSPLPDVPDRPFMERWMLNVYAHQWGADLLRTSTTRTVAGSER